MKHDNAEEDNVYDLIGLLFDLDTTDPRIREELRLMEEALGNPFDEITEDE